MQRVLICSQYTLFNQGLKQLLNADHDIEIIGCYASVDEALRRTQAAEPDAVLIINDMSAEALAMGQRFLRLANAPLIIELTLKNNDVRIYQMQQTRIQDIVDLVSALKESLSTYSRGSEMSPELNGIQQTQAGYHYTFYQPLELSNRSHKITMSDDNKIKKGLSRRTFLKGSGIAAASAGILAACGPEKEKSDDASTTAAECGRSWETPPTPIADSKIKETIDADVVIVGAGFSGMAATVRALEQGAKVAVIEKGATWSGRGGGAGVFTSRVMRAAGIELDKEEVAREWIEQCGNRAKEEMVWLFLNESGNAMDWFLDYAEEAGLPEAFIWGGYYKGPTYTEFPAYHMIMGGPMMMEGRDPWADATNMLYNKALELGATFYFETPAEQLFKNGDRIAGVIAKTSDGYKKFNAAKGVILATGDIGGDKEMMKAYAPLALQATEENGSDYYPIGQNTGDGHKMGMWIGAGIQNLYFPTVIHPQAYSWLHYAYLFVNARGQRYMNEDTWVQAKSLTTMRQPDAAWGYSIFDSKWPEEVAESVKIGGGMFWDSFRVYGQEWSPEYSQSTMDSYLEAGQWAWQADSLEELAAKIGVPEDTFLETVKRYNEIAKKGKDADFGKRAELLTTISEPPYYALKFGGALLVVVGGLSVDTKLRVLDTDQNPIPGLYAVGNVSGDLYGQDYPIQIPGNSHGRALTWGYLAGKNVMEEA